MKKHQILFLLPFWLDLFFFVLLLEELFLVRSRRTDGQVTEAFKWHSCGGTGERVFASL